MDEFTYRKNFGGIKLNIAHQKYINQILQEIDGSETEKADIAEEIAIHLQLSSEDFVKAGYEKKEAEKLAMNEFGQTNDIGKQMQEAIFPFRKIMFFILVIASFIYTYTVYSAQLFLAGDAHISWLVIAVVSSCLLLLFVLRIFPNLDRKITINSVLILHAFTFGYGIFLATSLENKLNIFFTIFSWAILLGTIALIYRTTVIDFERDQTIMTKHTRILHTINISYGIVVIFYTLFFVWGVLAFGGGFYLGATRLVIPFVIWLVAYYVQIRLAKHHKQKYAYIIAIIPAMMLIAIAVWLFS